MATILILDDDRITCQFLRDVLEKLFHHHVQTAFTIQMALTLSRNNAFDLMFLDQHLPDGTVLEFCQTLSQLENPQKTPKWLITGERPLEWDPAVWKRLGVQGILTKPFKIDQIETVINACLKN